MDTPTIKHQHIQSTPVNEGYGGGFLGNDANNVSAYPHKISLDLLRKQSHLSIDINKTPQLELDDQYNFFVGPEINSKAGSAEEEERSIIQAKMSDHENCLGPFLRLKTRKSRSSYGSISESELPSLVVMGCTCCYIYVMVSKGSPECPKCKNVVLIDEFQVSPAKKSRRN